MVEQTKKVNVPPIKTIFTSIVTLFIVQGAMVDFDLIFDCNLSRYSASLSFSSSSSLDNTSVI